MWRDETVARAAARIVADWGLDPVALERLESMVAGRVEGAEARWVGLASLLAARLDSVSAERHLLLGVSGGQGSGKSTFVRTLVRALELRSVSAFACSLDDFYLTHAERAGLAQSVHPLLATRGVPGTHDLDLLNATLDALLGGRDSLVPVFDKGRDDRAPRDAWRRDSGPRRVVILEGWCVGARPEPAAALGVPVNDLEAIEDAAGVWRAFVNRMLAGTYAALWKRLGYLVFFAVPDFGAVLRWRLDQEGDLPAGRRMDAPRMARFVSHYERLTAWMQSDLPAWADVTVELGPDHEVASFGARHQMTPPVHPVPGTK